jgi:threonine/homoserine/homoserine lactone efflux protein
MALWVYFFQGLVIGGTVAVAPGPLQAYLMAQSIRHGWRHTMPLILAPVITDIPIIAAVLIALVILPDGVVQALQVVGGCVLLYMAFDTYRHLKRPPVAAPPPKEMRENFFKAVVMNALTPGPYVFWSTIAGPVFMRGWHIDPWYGYVYLLGFGIALVGALAAYVLAASSARHLDDKYQPLITWATILILIGFGSYQVITGLFFPQAMSH